jgi:hypothetical protein
MQEFQLFNAGEVFEGLDRCGRAPKKKQNQTGDEWDSQKRTYLVALAIRKQPIGVVTLRLVGHVPVDNVVGSRHRRSYLLIACFSGL